MRRILIVSGGMIEEDFALEFLKGQPPFDDIIAADKGAAFSLRAEPGEFPAAFPPQWDAYTVLCCGAVAALLGLAEDGMELREEE